MFLPVRFEAGFLGINVLLRFARADSAVRPRNILKIELAAFTPEREGRTKAHFRFIFLFASWPGPRL